MAEKKVWVIEDKLMTFLDPLSHHGGNRTAPTRPESHAGLCEWAAPDFCLSRLTKSAAW